MDSLKTVKDIAQFFRKLPSIGTKSATRLAYSCLTLPKEDLLAFASVLQEAVKRVKPCPTCGLLTEDGACPICSDPTRDSSTRMVVTDTKDVLAVESSKSYHGKYFVLRGTLSPSNHRTVESIGLNALKDLVEKEKVKEVICCTGSDLEGETTALFIARMLSKDPVKLTKPASGLPSGAILEYADPLTIGEAIKGRVDINQKEDGD